MNKLYSSGQTVTLATGQSYTLKDNEVMIKGVIYRKSDIEITLENNGVISSSDNVKVGIRKRDGVSGMPAHYVTYDKWYIDDVQQTSLANCVENINTAIYYTGSSSGGQQDQHIKDYPASNTDLKDRNFYFKDVYESNVKPRGLYANALDLLNTKRIILNLGVGDYHSQGSNFFPVDWDNLDTYVIHASPSYGDIVITFSKIVQGKTLVLMLNPLDKNVTIEDIPVDKLTEIQPNVWNLIYIHFIGQMNKAVLGLGTTGTVNIYDITIKQPIIS